MKKVSAFLIVILICQLSFAQDHIISSKSMMVKDDVLAAMDLKDYKIFNIDLFKMKEDQKNFTLDLADFGQLSFDLKNMNGFVQGIQFASFVKMEDGNLDKSDKLQKESLSSIQSHYGTAISTTGIKYKASVVRIDERMMILLEDGERRLILRHLNSLVSGYEDEKFILYSRELVDQVCLNENAIEEVAMDIDAMSAQQMVTTPERIAKIAFDVDNETFINMCPAGSNEAQCRQDIRAFIIGIFAFTQDVFSSAFKLDMKISAIHDYGRTGDPYITGGGLNDARRIWDNAHYKWSSSFYCFDYDILIPIVRRPNNGWNGVATGNVYSGGQTICGTSSSSAHTQRTDFPNEDNYFAIGVVQHMAPMTTYAHEIGHLFGAVHTCSCNIMRSQLNSNQVSACLPCEGSCSSLASFCSSNRTTIRYYLNGNNIYQNEPNDECLFDDLDIEEYRIGDQLCCDHLTADYTFNVQQSVRCTQTGRGSEILDAYNATVLYARDNSSIDHPKNRPNTHFNYVVINKWEWTLDGEVISNAKNPNFYIRYRQVGGVFLPSSWEYLPCENYGIDITGGNLLCLSVTDNLGCTKQRCYLVNSFTSRNIDEPIIVAKAIFDINGRLIKEDLNLSGVNVMDDLKMGIYIIVNTYSNGYQESKKYFVKGREMRN